MGAGLAALCSEEHDAFIGYWDPSKAAELVGKTGQCVKGGYIAEQVSASDMFACYLPHVCAR